MAEVVVGFHDHEAGHLLQPGVEEMQILLHVRHAPRGRRAFRWDDHYRQRELGDANTSKTPSTKHTYEGYITKWICP